MLNQKYLLFILIPCALGLVFVMTEQNKIHEWQSKSFDNYIDSQVKQGNIIIKDGIPYLKDEATD